MNLEIERMTQEGVRNAVDMYKSMEDIRITLINIRISVAKIDNLEASALNVVANEIERSLLVLEAQAKGAQVRYKNIQEINKNS